MSDNSNAIFNDGDLGIPDYLRRAPQDPVFTTQEDAATGQVELHVEPNPEDVLAALGDDTPQGKAAVFVEAPQLPDEEHVSQEAKLAINEQLTEHPLPPTTHNMPADPAEMRRDFFKDVNKFGKASGEGASALGRLGLRALRAASDGILSTAKPTGGGKDDATLVYEAYTSMDSKHAEHTAGGAKANASKLRQVIGMGCMTTISDPVAIGDRVVRIREEMEGADLKPKALFAALVDVAREQQSSDTELTDDAIRAALTKPKADKTLEKEWEAISKRVEGLVSGENAAGLKDQSAGAIQIQELISEHVKNFKLEGTRKDRIADMMDNGYTLAQATAIVDRKIDLN